MRTEAQKQHEEWEKVAVQLAMDALHLKRGLEMLKKVSDMQRLLDNSHEKCHEDTLNLSLKDVRNLVCLVTKILDIKAEIILGETDHESSQ